MSENKQLNDENLEALALKYEEKGYKECDGLYIIYKGQIDVVNPNTR